MHGSWVPDHARLLFAVGLRLFFSISLSLSLTPTLTLRLPYCALVAHLNNTQLYERASLFVS